jgi:2-oxoisovalerate dehydrogenase E1 component alpha subunit
MIAGADPTPDEWEQLERIYRVVLLTRVVDERLWILSRQGRAGFVLTPRGHEVAQVATAAALRRGVDSAWPYYRDLGVGLALGVTPYELFLGALARADDPHSGGRQLTAHLSSPRLRLGSVSSAVAAHLPHAVGAAYAARVLAEDSVAMCWFGDGASSEGATHEAMNVAAIHRLPVVFVCEDNGYAISVPSRLQFAVPSVADRADAYGLAGATLDGTDALAVLRAAHEAVARARAGAGPSLLSLRVPRLVPHSSQDDDTYRSDAERAEAETADPLPRLRALLIDGGRLTAADALRGEQSLREAVAEDQRRALERPEPDASRARRWLFAGDPAHAYRVTVDAAPLAPGVFDGGVDG